MTVPRIIVTFAALTLAACGGGGGGGSVPQPVPDTRPIVSAVGGQSLNLSSVQIGAELTLQANLADTMRSTDFHTIDGDLLASTTCRGAVCRVLGVEIYPSDFDFGAGTFEAVTVLNGVSIVQGASRQTMDGETETSAGWGGWLDHTAFLVVGEAIEDAEGYGVGAGFGVSLGVAAGNVPVSGSATWRGVMIGYDFPRDEGLLGDAALTADFATASVDVVFSDVHELETGAARAGFGFNDVPLSGTGFASRVGGRIEGAFYGPSHAEVGGIFEHGNTIGAFGAQRQ